MQIVIDRTAMKIAESIFENTGLCINEAQIYGKNHPRFEKAKERVQECVAKYFVKSPNSGSLTYSINGTQVEFRRLPFANLQAHGARLLKALKAAGAGALQLKRGISAAEVGSLVELLANQKSNGPALQLEEVEVCFSAYRLISEKDARAMALARDGTIDPFTDGCGEGFSIPELRVSDETFEGVLSTYCSLFSSIEESQTFDYNALKQATDQVVKLFSESEEAAAPMASRSYFDDFTFHHSVNVSLITTKVASRVLNDRELLARISLAALLHDVGKTCVPAEILYKPARLTPEEFALLQTHPSDGAEILLGVDGTDPISVVVAFGHHLSPVMTSYPQTRSCYGSDWITELVSVVDIYEALTAVRPYKKALSPEKALQIMFSMPGLRNRLPIVKLLYDCEGPYPVGSLVELDTGERALVLQRNLSFPDRPRVRILTDEERHVLPDPQDTDLSIPRIGGTGGEPPRIVRVILAQESTMNPLTEEPVPEPTDILGAPLEDSEVLMAQEG